MCDSSKGAISYPDPCVLLLRIEGSGYEIAKGASSRTAHDCDNC